MALIWLTINDSFVRLDSAFAVLFSVQCKHHTDQEQAEQNGGSHFWSYFEMV